MIIPIKIKPIGLSDYKEIIGVETFEEIKKAALPLKGLKVLHLNTATEGGVGEILKSLIPLLLDLGIEAEWYNFSAPGEFFEVSKNIHNFLQGKKGDLSQGQKDTYIKVNEEVSRDLKKLKKDLWFIHDPQPAASANFKSVLHPSIWRCHIDTSTPNLAVWDWFKQFITEYDRYIFTLRKFIGPDLDYQKCRIFHPAIDPLSSKNKPIKEGIAKQIVETFHIDTKRPLVVQVSRFDPWKDPWGVIDAYRLAKKGIPGLQLALVGVMAEDDPESLSIFKDLQNYKKNDNDVHLLSNLDGVFAKEINAFQMAANIIIQKSTREGFGLTVSEAMWKAKPVIGGKAGGIKEQIVNGRTGFLITSAVETAKKIVYLLKNPSISEKMGTRGKDRVREKFLITRLLLDHLKLYKELV